MASSCTMVKHILRRGVRRVSSGMLLVLGLLALQPAAAQERTNTLPRVSPNSRVVQTVGVTRITITYGRPSVRNRTIFGELVPYGEVWRAGANEATTITFEDDVQVQGQPLKAGTYALFTIPGRDEWTFIFNKTADQWGAYNYDAGEDALRVTVTPQEAPFRELLTYTFRNVTDTAAEVVLRWAEVAVPFAVQTDTDAAVMEHARTMIPEAEHWQMPYSFAQYALNHGVFLDEAIHWSTKAIVMNENYNTLALNARLYARVEDFQEAVRSGEQALRRAQAMEEAPSDLLELENELASWKSRNSSD